MEAGEASVSVDLMIRSLLETGAKISDIAAQADEPPWRRVRQPPGTRRAAGCDFPRTRDSAGQLMSASLRTTSAVVTRMGTLTDRRAIKKAIVHWQPDHLRA
jgi:hypothetical protein